MFFRGVILLCGVALVHCNFGFNDDGFNNGFVGGIPFQSSNQRMGSQFGNSFNNAAGNAAGAGQAQAGGFGQSTSINQANHQADQFNSLSSGLSANSAQGTMGSSAGGAAQAEGQAGGGNSFGGQFGESNNLSQGRRKRSFGYPGNGFGPFSQSNANALGGGSALFGQVTTNNNAFTNSGPHGSTGMANGNAMGSGQGISLFNAANSQSGFERRKRQISFGGSGANSIGGGSAMFGNILTNNNAMTQSNPFGSMGQASGKAMGSGQGINLFNAANSQSGFGRRRRQIGFGGFGSSANSIGGGSAMIGNILTNNNAMTQSNQFGSMGQANGNAMGSGQGINLFNAASSQSGFGRRKRQIGFGGSDANSIGGGSAMFGNILTNNNAMTQSNPFGSMGQASGNAMGSGQGINLFNAANSQSNFGRRKRQVFLNPGFNDLGGFGIFNSAAKANASGTGSALAGTVVTNNNAFSQTNPFGASAMVASNAIGQGHGVQLSNAANSNSQSGNFS